MFLRRIYTFSYLAARKIAIVTGLWVPRPFIAVLALGQSNMEGCFGPPDPSMMEADERVRVWHLYSRKWYVACLGWRPFRAPSKNGTPNNPAYVFCRHLATERNAIVRLVLLASGGKRIEYFLPDATLAANGWRNEQDCNWHGASIAPSLFDPDGHALSALRSIKKPAFDAVLVQQGAGNFTGPDQDTAETYTAKVAALFTEMDRVGLRDDRTLTVVGQISPSYTRVAEHAEAVEAFADDRTAIVSWAGIETRGHELGNNDAHASGRGLQQLGDRFYAAYDQMAVARGHYPRPLIPALHRWISTRKEPPRHGSMPSKEKPVGSSAAATLSDRSQSCSPRSPHHT